MTTGVSFPQVEYADATGALRECYDDMQSTLRVPWVMFAARSLGHPGRRHRPGARTGGGRTPTYEATALALLERARTHIRALPAPAGITPAQARAVCTDVEVAAVTGVIAVDDVRQLRPPVPLQGHDHAVAVGGQEIEELWRGGGGDGRHLAVTIPTAMQSLQPSRRSRPSATATRSAPVTSAGAKISP
ncbi:hypothetical protein [Sporichthya sp.]|uniref:hypothetical protein n=1 Tax=Sporichthya sp. TaxID=65475 RepID=UPI0017AC1E7D|nr:hypothetical protein [Sporichthya sp.]MBA3743837.1 hypothetical protein [Sporichthya sp.]